MPDEHDSWLATTLGIDVQGFLGSNQETATVAPAPDAAIAEVSSSAPGSVLSSGAAAKPTIAVNASGTTFAVTGSGFLPNASVSVRTTQILPGQFVDLRTPTSSDANGNIAVNIAGPNVCAAVGPIFFSATDGREDRTDRLGVLFSNAVEMSCLPLSPDKPDDPDDPPDQPDPAPADPTPSEEET